MIKTGRSTKNLLVFHYTGLNNAGHKVIGDIEARSLLLAKVSLRSQGILIKKVTRKRNVLFSLTSKKINAADIAVFTRQLATMIESGIPLVQAFTIIAKGQSNQRLKSLIADLKADVETGLTLSQTLFKRSIYFNDLFCNLVDAGEQSGTLDIMLNKIATYKEKIETIKKKIKKALTYPMAVLLIALLVTTGLLIFIVPQFDALFKSFGAELPMLTQIIVALSEVFQSYGYLIAGGIAAAFFVCKYAHRRSRHFVHFIDGILLKLPILGPIIKKAAIARFSRTLSITFAAGLPLIAALESVAGATGNTLFANATKAMINEIATGQQINKAMKNTQLFPEMVVQMITIGEESGALEKMLHKVADFYEEDVDNLVNSLSSLLEPIIMAIMGILVGGLVVAMYLPIFKLGSAL